MLRSMSSAISGMDAFQTDLDVVGNNIANVNTVGYKSSSANFADVLSQTTAGGNAGTAGTVGGTNPQQVGLGVKVASTALDFSQGPTATTGSATDVAINGTGMFVVQPNGSSTNLYTRAGDFNIDSAGNLVLPNGAIAMGYPVSDVTSGTLSTSATLQKINLKTLDSGVTPASNPNVQIGSDGSITVTDTSNNNVVIGYLATAVVPNNDGLQKQGDNLYSTTSASGTAAINIPGANNTGSLQSGALEQSNVDLAKEFSEMIVAQNGFVANTHMIGTDNQVLQALQNMKNA